MRTGTAEKGTSYFILNLFCYPSAGDNTKVEVSAQGLPVMNGDARLASGHNSSASGIPGKSC